MQCTRASSTKPNPHTHTHTVGSEGSRDGVRRRTAAASSICNSIHVVEHGGGLAMGLVGSLLLRLVGEKLSDLPRHIHKREEICQYYGNISCAYNSFTLVSVCTPRSPERRLRTPRALRASSKKILASSHPLQIGQSHLRCKKDHADAKTKHAPCPSLCFSSPSQTISNLSRKNVASRAA